MKPGVIAIDGTRLAGNANSDSTREFEQIAREILAEHKATDEAEDQQFGEARGDELPEQLRTAEGGVSSSLQAKRPDRSGRRRGQQLTSTASEEECRRAGAAPEPEFEFDEKRIVARTQGREGWSREARRQLEQHRWEHPDPVPRSRSSGCCWRPSGSRTSWRPSAVGTRLMRSSASGAARPVAHRVGGPPKPYQPPEVPDGKVNLTDPDSKRLKAREGYVQGFNAQAVVSERQIVLAAEITNSNTDWSQLGPMVTATLAELARAGVGGRIETALADAQFWNEEHMDEVIANKHIQVLIPPDGSGSGKQRAGWTGGRYTWMRYVLASELGHELYRKRKQMIEPVFGHTRHNRGVTRFLRRGRSAVRTEWRLLMATHNLAKLHRHQIATVGA